MLTSSSSAIGRIQKAGKFEFSAHFLPYHDDIAGAPQNSIIGGATLWVMAGRKPDEYKGIAKFFSYLSRPEVQMNWHAVSHRRLAQERLPLQFDQTGAGRLLTGSLSRDGCSRREARRRQKQQRRPRAPLNGLAGRRNQA